MKQSFVSWIGLDNDLFYLKYQAVVNPTTSLTGTVINTAQIEEQVGITNCLRMILITVNFILFLKLHQQMGFNEKRFQITQALSQTTFARRKRSKYETKNSSDRIKRDVQNNIALVCTPIYPKTCIQAVCKNRFKKNLFHSIETTQTISNISLTIRSRQFGDTSNVLDFIFLEISTESEYKHQTRMSISH